MRFTNRQILKIAGPILVSVLMEHLIGMTDTVFWKSRRSRTGSFSPGRSVLSGHFHAGFRFQYRGTDYDRPAKRRRKLYGDRRAVQPGIRIPISSGYFYLFCYPFRLSFATPASDRLATGIRSYFRVYEPENFRFVLFVYGVDVSCLLCRNCRYADTNRQLPGDGRYECCAQLYPDIRETGFSCFRNCGAAIASVLAEVTSLLFFIVYTGLKIDRQKYRLYRFHRIEIHLLKRILGISIWTMVQAFISISTWFLFLSLSNISENGL